jgi:hypothetical protein
MNTFIRSTLATLALIGMIVSATALPAKADGASTTRTILESLAAVAIVATAVNVAHKNAQANAIVGYLSNGEPVYQDGHIVAPNGQSWYPSQYGQSVSCNNGNCYLTASNNGNGYNNNGYNNNGYNNNGYNNNGYNSNGYNSNGYQRRPPG